MSDRSLLFVPGNRPERFDKAYAAGADVVLLDLEDAVAPDYKAAAPTPLQRTASSDGSGRVGGGFHVSRRRPVPGRRGNRPG